MFDEDIFEINKVYLASADYRCETKVLDANSALMALSMILRILNSITRRRARNSKLIIDCTDVSDLNWFRKPLKQANLLKKDYKWGYSAKGCFVGMKLTLVLEYPCKPLLFLLHPANRHEARLFSEIMDELKRRRILRQRDVIILDRGFYAYKNYLIGINEYRIVPLIFPKRISE